MSKRNFKNLSLCFFILLLAVTGQGQHKTKNLVIVTLDGMRWQEIFGGVDEVLLNDSTFNHDREGLKNKFWAVSPEERRQKLFPFLWSVIAAQGQIYGNRKYDNKIDNANRYWFSYPGYNEIFTGYPDSLVNSNDKIYNKNESVLEFINKQKGYKGKVAAFSTWDAFPFILNEPRSKIYVNADIDTLQFKTPALSLLNDMQFLTNKPSGVRPDVITYFAAREYLKEYKPKVLYIAFDETDHFAHEGLYDQYIGSAYSQDAMIGDLWKLLQSMPQYKNKTSLLITCDHGRGDKKKSDWKHHGSKIAEAHEIWLAAIGPDIKALGEIKTPMQLYQMQLATTIAKLLRFNFKPTHPVQDPVGPIFE
ncbi:MAG TPA: alkaline phosphatase family protein [Chitinophagaceae bacterium]|nr:alkaline phosphatase family protein [Chitinophagaceae bacterium]